LPKVFHFPHRHLLGIEGLSTQDIRLLLDLAEEACPVFTALHARA
jgi:hypothetical protein